MIRPLATILIFACICPFSAQAAIFDLSDDSIDIVPAQPEKPSPPQASAPVAPRTEVPAPVAPAPSSPPILAPPASPAPAAAVVPPSPPSTPVTGAVAVRQPPLPAHLPAQFTLWSEAHAAYLRQDWKAAFLGCSRLIVQAKKAKQPSPFTEAAEFLRERVRFRAGDAQDKAKAIANLGKLAEADTPWRGDILLLLARERMDANAPLAAKPWLEKLGPWIKDARASREEDAADAADFLAPWPVEAQVRLRPPTSPWMPAPDVFGRPVRREEVAGGLVTARSAAWHLDEIEEEYAKASGFCAFLVGDKASVKKHWGRLAELERMAMPGGMGPAKAGKESVPARSPAAKLRFAADHGRMLAYVGEEHLLDPWPKAKDRVLYAEYLFLSDDLSGAIGELEEVLAADDLVRAKQDVEIARFKEAQKKMKGGMWMPKLRQVGMTDVARDYVELTMATVLHRAGRPQEALAHMEKAFVRVSNSETEHRAVVGFVNAAHLDGDASQRARADQLEAALLASPCNDRWVKLARFNRAVRLARTGKKQDALRLLAVFKPMDGRFHDYAKAVLEAARSKGKVQ